MHNIPRLDNETKQNKYLNINNHFEKQHTKSIYFNFTIHNYLINILLLLVGPKI